MSQPSAESHASLVEARLAELTLEEKVGLLAGRDFWHLAGAPRVGIPEFKMTDGPAGARGKDPVGEGQSSACFPCGSALAASWNPALIEEVGVALGEEARSKHAQLLLAPTVNLQRHPAAGRHFECLSEDPHLGAQIAAAYVRGVQETGVGACIKHFVCNDQEHERHTISAEVDERTLREIYLPPFEAAVCDEGVLAVMAAYNRLNGTYCAEHDELLNGILKTEWGFEGLVVSDWFGTRSTVGSALGGLDCEMPGPPRWYGKPLLEAVEKGEVAEAVIDAKVRRILAVMLRSGAFGENPASDAERADDRPEHRALARRAAREATVLLRNEGGLLPLDVRALRSVALLGPNAADARIQGGGSAGVLPHRAVSPLEGLRAALPQHVTLLHERGCSIEKTAVPIDADRVRTRDGEPGIRAEFFADGSFEGTATAVATRRRLRCTWFGEPAAGVGTASWAARFHCRFDPPEDGTYTYGLASTGRSRLYANDELLIDNWEWSERGDAFFGYGSREARGEIALRAGVPCEIRVEFLKHTPGPLAGLEAGVLLPEPPDLMERAVAAAAAADVAVVVVGTNADWESEGRDRETLALPGRQVELIERVAAANPRTAVVVNAGAPVGMEWAPRVPAALAIWFPGQECGHALADVLLGASDPGGRLPMTLPRSLADVPVADYPGKDGVVRYGEGVFVGYRGYDARQIEPRFPFGHGLSYARFEYGELRVPSSALRVGEIVEVELDVTNVSVRAGEEVVQLYVHDEEASVPRPVQELRAFTKLALEPGASATVRFALGRRAFAFWHPEQRAWTVEPGRFELRVGASSRDVRAQAHVELAA